MRQVIFFLFTLFDLSAKAQQEPLYYFISKDSLLGVKDSKGKIIIPAKHLLIYDVKSGDKVEKEFISLFEVNDTSYRSGRSFGKVYNRKGEFLYRPFNYDVGPDYIREGLIRFVEKGKVGFVDRHAKKVIPAQFDYVSEFNLGTAVFCTGCYPNREEDAEHPPLRGGYFGLINKEGKILINRIPNDTGFKAWKKLDSLKGYFYPLEFNYTSFEQRLIDKLGPYKKTIEKEHFSNFSGFAEPKSLLFTIVEKPSAGFPYYIIRSYEKFGNKMFAGDTGGPEFYISRDGKKIYYNDYSEKLIPFSKWFSIYSKGGRDYD